jgi:5-methyltetrahydropteroyltriglutamate--homocysteine methyltransferase
VTDAAAIAAQVTPAIAETVRKQVEAGIDCIGDGEFWTARSLAHYTAHFTGIEARPVAPGEPPTTRYSTRARDEFPDFYADCDRAGTLFLVPGEKPMPPVTVRVVARGPVKSKGPEAINRQLDTFKAAIERSGAEVDEAFVPVLAPGWLDHFICNECYKTEDEFLFALAGALREEYRAVVTAGFVLQIDDPGLPDWWDMLKPEPTVEACRQFARRRIDAENTSAELDASLMTRPLLFLRIVIAAGTHDAPPSRRPASACSTACLRLARSSWTILQTIPGSTPS